MKKYNIIWVILLVLVIACGRYKTPEPTIEYGNNVLQKPITEISSNEYFVMNESNVRLATLKNESISISEALPIDQKFVSVLGNKDVIFLQTLSGLSILKKKDKEEAYENIIKLEKISKCDLLAIGQDYLVVASGSNDCKSSASPSLSFYDIKDVSKPLLKFTTSINSPTSIKTYYKKIFVGEGSKGFRIFEFDGTNKPVEVFRAEDKTANQVYYYTTNNTLLVKNESEIYQYSLDNISKPTLLSTIKINK